MAALIFLVGCGMLAMLVGLSGVAGAPGCSPSALGWGIVFFALAFLHFSLQQAVEILRVIARRLTPRD